MAREWGNGRSLTQTAAVCWGLRGFPGSRTFRGNKAMSWAKQDKTLDLQYRLYTTADLEGPWQQTSRTSFTNAHSLTWKFYHQEFILTKRSFIHQIFVEGQSSSLEAGDTNIDPQGFVLYQVFGKKMKKKWKQPKC